MPRSARLTSIDASRGFVMFMMIFVNDLGGAGRIVPDWMVHFSDRHHGGSDLFYVISDVRPIKSISHPLALAGHNVLLPYLISEMLPSLVQALGLGGAYAHLAANLPSAIGRSVMCAVLVLLGSIVLNRVGFRLKL